MTGLFDANSPVAFVAWVGLTVVLLIIGYYGIPKFFAWRQARNEGNETLPEIFDMGYDAFAIAPRERTAYLEDLDPVFKMTPVATFPVEIAVAPQREIGPPAALPVLAPEPQSVVTAELVRAVVKSGLAPAGDRAAVGYVNGTQNPVMVKTDSHGIVLGGSTGGKTNIFLTVVTQALKEGITIWYATGKWCPIPKDKAFDLRTIVGRCERYAVGMDAYDSFQMLMDASAEVERRGKLAETMQQTEFPPLLVVFDELKSLFTALWPRLEKSPGLNPKTGMPRLPLKDTQGKAETALRFILSIGAELGVRLFVVSQDGYVKNIGLQVGDMNNFSLVLAHPETDPFTLKNVLPRFNFEPVDGGHLWWTVQKMEPRMEDRVILTAVPRVTQQWVDGLLATTPIKHLDLFGVPETPAEEVTPVAEPQPVVVITRPEEDGDSASNQLHFEQSVALDGRHLRLLDAYRSGATSWRSLARAAYPQSDGGGRYSELAKKLATDITKSSGIEIAIADE